MNIDSTKKCKDCGEEKDINEYKPKEKVRANGEKYIHTDPRCKDCRVKISRANYQKNKEKHIKAVKKYYRKNSEKQREYAAEYAKRNKDKYLNYFVDYYQANKERMKEESNKWRINNKEYFNKKQRERKEMENSLPNELSENLSKEIFNIFENKSALTEEANELTLDHFIPINWGHGGSTKSNLYPVEISLNQSKGSVNPFDWVRKNRINTIADHKKWDKLVEYLAAENNLNVHEYISFVNWCEMNKRNIEQVKNDGDISSLELWKMNNFQ